MRIRFSSASVALCLVLLSVVLAAGCGKSKNQTSTLPLASKLKVMTLQRDDLRSLPDIGKFDHSDSMRTNAIQSRSDAKAHEQSLINAGRLLGFRRSFSHLDALANQSGLYAVDVEVEAYQDAAGARKALDLERDFGLKGGQDGLSFTPGVIVREFEVGGLDKGAWGIVTTVDEEPGSGMPLRWSVSVEFVVDDVVASVRVNSYVEEDTPKLAQSLAKALKKRIATARRGRFDDEFDAKLSASDLLSLSHDLMSREKNLHLTTARRIRLAGQETAYILDYDVAFPEKVAGYIEVPGFPEIEIFMQGNVAFYRDEGAWQCLEDATDGNPRSLGFVTPDFDLMYGRMAIVHVNGVATSSIDQKDAGGGFLRLSTTLNARDFLDLAPEILGPDSALRGIYPNIGDGKVSVEFVISSDDYRLSEFSYEMRLPVPGDQVLVRSESLYSAAVDPRVFPDSGTLPLCAQYDDPPCKGTRLSTCIAPERELRAPLVSRENCDGDGRRVCIVPVGALPKRLLDGLIARLKEQLDADIRVAPGISVYGVDKFRDQVPDDAVLHQVEAQYSQLFKDPSVVIIAITPVDMFSKSNPNLRFIFGQRFGDYGDFRWGMISTHRMDPVSYGLPADEDLLLSRLTKMTMKYVLTMYYGYKDSGDPTSLVYNGIGGLDALDAIIPDVKRTIR